MSIQFNSMIFNVRTLVTKILASDGRSIINMQNLNESPHALGQMEKMNNLHGYIGTNIEGIQLSTL